jgi:hypothetical protein
VRRNRERVGEILFVTSNNEREIMSKLYVEEEDDDE